jgi:hypothetical protein
MENDWEYDSAIPTDDGHAKVYKLKNDPYTELQVNEDGTYIYYKTRVFELNDFDGSSLGPGDDKFDWADYFSGADCTECPEVRMEFYNFQVFTGPDEVPSAYLSEEEKAPENSNIAQCQGAQSEDLAEWTQLLFYATLISKSLGYSSAPSGYSDKSMPYSMLGSNAG